MCLALFKKPVLPQPEVPPVVIEPEPVELKPTSHLPITLPELYSLLSQTFPGADIFLSDNTKLLCHYDDVALFLAQDSTNREEYKDEAFDCDDFARRLYGQFAVPGWSALAFGLVWTNLHALNLIVDEDKKVWFVEPQLDEIQAELKEWQGNLVRFVIL